MIASSLAYLDQPSKPYLPDLFHICLAGAGQDYAASAIVYTLPILFAPPTGSSVDKHLEVLNTTFTCWRKMFRVPVHMTCFNRERLNFQDATKVNSTVLGPRLLTPQEPFGSLPMFAVAGVLCP